MKLARKLQMRWLFAPPKKADPHAVAMRDRAALLKRERALTREIERLYRLAKRRIAPELDALAAKIAEARKLGLVIGLSWLESEARLTALLDQIEAQIGAFARASAAATEKAQRVSVARGSIDTIGAFREAARYAGINASFNRLPVEALQHLAGTLEDGTPLAAWFDAFGPKARKAASEALFTGLAEGLGPKEIARDLRDAVDMSKTSAMLTARQASVGSYRAATHQEYVANRDVVQGWRWACSYSVRTCAMCIAMDGTEHSVLEKLISHLACRCVQIAILIGAIEQPRTTGPQWFKGLDAATQDTILGPLKGRLYRQGDIGLADLPKQGRDVKWGEWRAEKSVRDLVREGTLSNAKVAEAAKAAR